MSDLSAIHDAYAADYDAQIIAYECRLAEALFGLCYADIRPAQTLLDAGIGSGLSAAPFARAGLRVSGMDFSPAMLDLCRAKGITADLQLHDLQNPPWPYGPTAFDHAICVGVIHFIPDPAPVFSEAARVLRPGGLWAFTTKWPSEPLPLRETAERHASGGLEIFSHAPAHVETLLAAAGFTRVRALRCFVGPDVHGVWVTHRTAGENDHER